MNQRLILLVAVLSVVVLIFVGCETGSTRVIFCQDIVPIILDPIDPSYELRSGTFYALLEAVQPFGVEEITTRFWKVTRDGDRFVKEVSHEIDPRAEVIALDYEIDDIGDYKVSFLLPNGRRIASGQFSLY